MSSLYMDTTTIILSVVIALLIGGFIAYIVWSHNKFKQLEAEAEVAKAPLSPESRHNLMAALERLTLFAERTKLESLVSRFNGQAASAAELRQLLTASIREEYDYNLTQQLFVSPTLWDAISKLKDQNIYIIHSISEMVDGNSDARGLGRKLLEYEAANPEGTLNQTVLNALQFEMKKLLS